MAIESASIKILLVDDEQDILDFLRYNLERSGYQVFTALKGQDALEINKTKRPHLILLDLMMPVMDGMETCQLIREDTTEPQPIIAFLTSRSEDYSQVAGFEAGADDYITKPIRPRLLISKIEALLRRLDLPQNVSVEVESTSLRINRDKFLVYRGDEELFLPKKEFELLEFLLARPGHVFGREEIMHHVWGQNVVVGERTIDVHIRKLREKLGDDYIRTIKGVGYTVDLSEKQ